MTEDEVRRIVREEIRAAQRASRQAANIRGRVDDARSVAVLDQLQAAKAETCADQPEDGPTVRAIKAILRGED